MSSTSLLPINGGHLLFSQGSSFPNYHTSATLYKWGWKRQQGGNVVAYRTNGHALQILANPNPSVCQTFISSSADKSPSRKIFAQKVSSRKRDSSNQVIMVDPLEAKRLAAKQMEEIKAKEKYKRKRQIEAINGAWAMIGLTAGLVIEAQTGKSILDQLVGYLNAIVSIFMPQ